MATIQATVNSRLLSKASRLFTGTLAGRIIEILQNARRAKAKHVAITNTEGTITVQDDGRGIEDFEKLLDLGGSGWEEKLEASEDPAGVGLFCLPRARSPSAPTAGKSRSQARGWTGAPVEVRPDPRRLSRMSKDGPADAGTELSFKDEPWTMELVKPLAVFTGLEVTVMANLPERAIHPRQATLCRELGCRIKVVRGERTDGPGTDRALLPGIRRQRSGQLPRPVIGFSHRPVTGHDLHYLVDMTGQPTGIRLMLPARTCWWRTRH